MKKKLTGYLSETYFNKIQTKKVVTPNVCETILHNFVHFLVNPLLSFGEEAMEAQ